jgi:hypothetical protein
LFLLANWSSAFLFPMEEMEDFITNSGGRASLLQGDLPRPS